MTILKRCPSFIIPHEERDIIPTIHQLKDNLTIFGKIEILKLGLATRAFNRDIIPIEPEVDEVHLTVRPRFFREEERVHPPHRNISPFKRVRVGVLHPYH
ncbi:MAG: hypothetical protein ACTSRS_07610 [Candidatus Helarchaeota archaeon]